MVNVVYTRVSTKSQGEESLEFQSIYCTNYLNENGQQVNSQVSEISSGFNGTQKLLVKLITENKYQNIYVKNVSRFSRNVLFAMNLLEKAKLNNNIIHFIEEGINSNNESIQHILRVKLSEAQHESEVISKRAKDSFKVKKALGWRFGKASFGKKSLIRNGIRVHDINIVEKKVVDFICQARDGTTSKMLNIKLRKIDPSLPPIDFYDVDGKKIDKFNKCGTLTFGEIAELLNDYKVLNRNKLWSASSVSKIYNIENGSIFTKLNEIKNSLPS